MATAMVMHPPKITEGTVPINFAATPLSNWPNSLDEFINILFTLITLPLNSSGTLSCSMVLRTITLMPSMQPLISNAVNESQKLFDMAKTIMQIPKPNTAKNNFFPWPYLKGKMVSSVTVIIEPISLAAFNMPKPSGPTFKISLAKTGTKATAPPNNTANKSSVSAPKISLVLKTYRRPSFTLCQVDAALLAKTGLVEILLNNIYPAIVNNNTAQKVFGYRSMQ